ncbi:MAG: hypothetical protein FWH36_06065 [Lentimicrobiaceae bacterium]|nr:hypothetical protein [Lentimicrobiaceae bacterium]
MNGLRKILWGLFFGSAFVLCTYGQSDTLNRTDKFGKKYGSWEKYDGKTLLWKGRFYNGEPVGEFIYYHPNKQVERILNYYPNSPKVSCVSFYTNGAKSSEGIFINKEKDGKWLYYNTNGKMVAEENYDKGKKHGKFKLFSKEGVLLEEETWNNNVKEGEFNTYYTTGAPRIKMSYAKGKMHGGFENYYEDGTIWNRGQYKDDFRNGTWTSYNRDGNEARVEEIEMGVVKQMFLGVATASQWLKIDINRIAYIYQDANGFVLQLKDKKKIQLSENNSLTSLSYAAGNEFFILVNDRVLASYDAIRKIIPISETEAQIILRPESPFEVFTYDNYYEAVKSFIDPSPPKE